MKSLIRTAVAPGLLPFTLVVIAVAPATASAHPKPPHQQHAFSYVRINAPISFSKTIRTARWMHDIPQQGMGVL